jgi:hypothetical protein
MADKKPTIVVKPGNLEWTGTRCQQHSANNVFPGGKGLGREGEGLGLGVEWRCLFGLLWLRGAFSLLCFLLPVVVVSPWIFVIPAATLPAPAPVCPCALACAGDTVASCVPVLNSGAPQFDAERACSVPYLLRPPAKLMGC